ncbi:MAG: hypothetical protein ACRYFS_18250 [Janthinobacterium lividum]
MPHQGFVSLSISVLSIIITMSVLFSILRHEKKIQSQNTDEH